MTVTFWCLVASWMFWFFVWVLWDIRVQRLQTENENLREEIYAQLRKYARLRADMANCHEIIKSVIEKVE